MSSRMRPFRLADAPTGTAPARSSAPRFIGCDISCLLIPLPCAGHGTGDRRPCVAAGGLRCIVRARGAFGIALAGRGVRNAPAGLALDG
ncbi:MAG: hypothetical protein MZV64_49250 [Ignavibacteriales bacterium]|nr:hypothetical protein [Ignavibacteriales bacterium]